MVFSSLGKALLAFGLFQCVFSKENSTIEINYLTACEVCTCGPGPSLQPKELVKCDDPKGQLKFLSLPDFVRGIEIINAQFGAIFMRGAIRVREKFRVVVKGASSVDFQEKSTTILNKKGQVTFELEKIKQMKVRSRAVSSSAGSFDLKLVQSETVDIEGQAFDVINKIELSDLNVLTLAPAAFKPNVQLSIQQPFTKILLRNITSIPILSMEVFSSAHSIIFQECQIAEIESRAFSAFSINNITFDSSQIDRIHTGAFPDQALISNLAIHNCNLTSISEKAVTSAITSFTISRTNVSSISKEAFQAQVANVRIDHCIFKTLVEKSFEFRSWNKIIFENNFFTFLEENAFLGMTEPNTPSSFHFVSNRIQFANRNALKLDKMSKSAKNVTKKNIFHKDCECDFDKWLMVVSGETDFLNPSEWTIDLLNSSLCTVPLFAKGCFNNPEILLSQYSDKMCSIMASNLDCSHESPWEILQDQIEITTNKGILLLLLMFVLASTLIVSILTLLRWIVYTIQARKFHKNDEWSFTKIEEQQKLKENDAVEEEAIELQDSSPSPEHYESLVPVVAPSTPATLPASEAAKRTLETVVIEKEPLLEAKLPEHATEGKPPTQTTFYDEMICLLQEKLEDPENYSTVVDDKDTHNATFYMDPMYLKKT